MNENPLSGNHPPSWEGHRLQADSEAALCAAIEHACDYRGDVTIHLKTGEQVSGYVFDRQERTHQPHIKMYLANQTEPSMVKYQDIAEVEFSGEDTAFGRSWEDWAKKWQNP